MRVSVQRCLPNISNAVLFEQEKYEQSCLAGISAANTLRRMRRRDLTKEEKKDAERLWALWEEHKRQTGMTQAELADQCGWSNQSAAGQYLKGVIPLNIGAMLKFSRVLKVRPEAISPRLAAELDQSPRAARDVPKTLPPGAHKFGAIAEVPVVGTTQGGPPDRIWEELGHAVGYSDEYLEVSTPDPHAYALRVVGSSMAPRIMEGEWLLVEPGQGAQPGDDVVVKTSDGRVMVKQLVSRHNGTIILASVNEAFDRIRLDERELQFMHFVAGRFAARSVKRRIADPIITDDGEATEGRRIVQQSIDHEDLRSPTGRGKAHADKGWQEGQPVHAPTRDRKRRES